MVTYFSLAIGHYCLLLFTITAIVAAVERSEAAEVDHLKSCLSSSGMTNFTARPPSTRPSDPTFDRLLYSSAYNMRYVNGSHAKPLAVVLPTRKQELRAAVLCCRQFGVAIRIRSGGHSYEGLSYTSPFNAASFAVIDLRNLARVRVDAASRWAWVEAGATLGEVYHAVAEASGGTLALSAGSCPTVGSGGHVAGGGFGFLSRKHGLAADNVMDAVLVGPDGRLLDRESMGKDVFWAVRGGGGGCWGAVYAWKLRLVPVPRQVTVFVVNRPGSARDVAGLVHTWQRVAHGLPDEFYLSASVGARLPESVAAAPFSATFKGMFLGPKAEAVSLMTRRFPSLGIAEPDCKEMSWIESVLFFSGLPEGSRVSDLKSRSVQEKKKHFKAKSDYVKHPISLSDLANTFDLLTRQPNAYLILDPYGGVMDRIPSDKVPFPHRRGNLYSIQYLIEWLESDTESGYKYLDWIRRFHNYMEPFVSASPRAAYINYLDLDLGAVRNTIDRNDDNAVQEARIWGERYFLGNYDRLVKVKTRFDPHNVFQNAQSVPPMPTAVQRIGT